MNLLGIKGSTFRREWASSEMKYSPLSKPSASGRVRKNVRQRSLWSHTQVLRPIRRSAVQTTPRRLTWRMKFIAPAREKHISQITPPAESLHCQPGSNNEVTWLHHMHLNFLCWQRHTDGNPSRHGTERHVFLLALLDMEEKPQNSQHRTPTSVANKLTKANIFYGALLIFDPENP